MCSYPNLTKMGKKKEIETHFIHINCWKKKPRRTVLKWNLVWFALYHKEKADCTLQSVSIGTCVCVDIFPPDCFNVVGKAKVWHENWHLNKHLCKSFFPLSESKWENKRKTQRSGRKNAENINNRESLWTIDFVVKKECERMSEDTLCGESIRRFTVFYSKFLQHMEWRKEQWQRERNCTAVLLIFMTEAYVLTDCNCRNREGETQRARKRERKVTKR